MNLLSKYFFGKFFRYFIIIYMGLLVLYWLIDSFEKSLRVVDSEAVFFSFYALSSLAIVALQQMNNALLLTAFFLLYDFFSLKELESVVLVNISPLRALQHIFLFLFISHGILFVSRHRVMPFLIQLQLKKKAELHFKAKKIEGKWFLCASNFFMRQSNKCIDYLCRRSEDGFCDIQFFDKNNEQYLVAKGHFFNVIESSHFIDLSEIKSQVREKAWSTMELEVIGKRAFCLSCIQIYSFFIWFFYAPILLISFFKIIVFWYFFYLFLSFISIFLARWFLCYYILYVPLLFWVAGIVFLVWCAQSDWPGREYMRGYFY